MKIVSSLMLLAMLSLSSSAAAQEDTGAAAVNARNMGKNNEWQNWIFAISAMATATAGVLVVSLDQGSSIPAAHSH